MVFAPIEMTSTIYSLSMNLMLYAFKKPFWFQSLTTTSSILLIVLLLLLFLSIIKTPYSYLNIDTTIPCTVVPIFIQCWITIVSVYFSPSHPIDFDNLHDLISQLSSPLMIVLYFNRGHRLWGDSVVNSRQTTLT